MNSYKFIILKVFNTKKAWLIFVTSGLIYLLLTSIVLNYKQFSSLYQTSISIQEKVLVTPALILRTFQTHSALSVILHITVAVLFAANIVLIFSKIAKLKNPSLKISLGAGIISLTTAGCASCGLSLLTVLGVGGALTLLPFKGIEILLITIAILFMTLFYNTKMLLKACRI